MQNLRLALRRYAKAVTVITAQDGDRRYAMSATAVCEVSFDPPTMLICVNRSASIHSALRVDAPFCLNILNEAQEQISRSCGGEASGEDRFSSGIWEVTASRAPRLVDAEASIVCRVTQMFAVGTHDIVIGEVEEAFASETCNPLIYLNGTYVQARARIAVP